MLASTCGEDVAKTGEDRSPVKLPGKGLWKAGPPERRKLLQTLDKLTEASAVGYSNMGMITALSSASSAGRICAGVRSSVSSIAISLAVIAPSTSSR